MNCPSCYATIDDDSTFCSHCGRNISVGGGATERIVTVGRAGDNTLVIAEPGISSHHAVLKVHGEKIVVEDLNSTNGTYVNGKKIMIATVQWGDSLSFGKGAHLDWRVLERIMGGGLQRSPSAPTYGRPEPPARMEPPARQAEVVPVQESSRKSRKREETPPPKHVVQRQQSVHAGLGGELAYPMHMQNCPACGSDRLMKYTMWLGKKKQSKQGGGCIGCLLFIIILILAPGLVLLFGIAVGATLYALRTPIIIAAGLGMVVSILVRVYQSKLIICEACGHKFSNAARRTKGH